MDSNNRRLSGVKPRGRAEALTTSNRDADAVHLPTSAGRSFDAQRPRPPPPSQKAAKAGVVVIEKEPKKPCKERIMKFCYNKEAKTFCDRTCKNWVQIIGYSLFLLLFLCTFTMICLVISLWILRNAVDFQQFEKVELMTYAQLGIGLSATPTSESSHPLIWYRKNHVQDYQKYVNAIDNLLIKKRKKHDTDTLGPCGVHPFGYGEKPCVILRINKLISWSGKPLEMDSTETKNAPSEVKTWIEKDKKLWLYCEGYHSYDKEHVGRIKYYPYPPGFDPSIFPLKMEDEPPVIAIQISQFTEGVSVAIECKLWYKNGPSSIDFMLYVVPDDVPISNRTGL